MILPKFDYQAPESISEVCSLLSQARGRAAIMAGGTDLMVQMKQQTLVPEFVVSLKKLPGLDGLNYRETRGLEIGPMVSLRKLAASAVVREHFPVLAEAAALVGAAQHQFMGTVGGNLCLDTRCWYYNQTPEWRRSMTPCHKLGGNTCNAVQGARKCYAVYSADVGAVLFALNARIVVNSTSQKDRVVPLEEFFSGDPVKPFRLGKDELIISIVVPPERPRFARYYKVRPREAIDFPEVGVALAAFPEKNEYRVVFNAVHGMPLRFREIEALLSKDSLSDRSVADFTTEVIRRIKPVANGSGSPAYRRKMAETLLRIAFDEMRSVL